MTTENPTKKDRSLAEYLLKVRKLNFDEVIQILGIHENTQGYIFDFFGRSILYDRYDFFDSSGKTLSDAIKTLFCQYLLNSPSCFIKSSNRLVTFREFPGSGPLFSRFTENTNKTIQQTFSNRLELLEKECKRNYGVVEYNTSYDLSVKFKALPAIPIVLRFNDADDLFPATSACLFYDDASNYLDLKSLATITTYLTGLLIQNCPEN